MNRPSVARLMRDLNLDHATATQLREALALNPDMHTAPAVGDAIRRADRILGTCGVERFAGSRGAVSYCNTGDTYAPTLCLIERPQWHGGRSYSWHVGSWGDLVERRTVGVTS